MLIYKSVSMNYDIVCMIVTWSLLALQPLITSVLVQPYKTRLAVERSWSALDGPFLHKRCRKCSSNLVGAPFLAP